MAYQVIALDLDGTLLTSEKKILTESLQALSNARQQGIKVIIVTGRHHVAIKPFYHQLELDTPALCCNGSYMYNFQNQTISHGNPLSQSQALSVIDLLKHENIHSLMYLDNAMTYEQENENIRRWHQWSQQQPEQFRPTIIQVDNFKSLTDNSNHVWKFATSCNDEKKLQDIARQLEDEMGLTCDVSWHQQMDIAQSGNSKGVLLKQWVESQNLTMSDVVAFGDNFNDLSMIEMAGLGVAMGNSGRDIQDRADLVIGSNEAPSIATLINQQILA